MKRQLLFLALVLATLVGSHQTCVAATARPAAAAEAAAVAQPERQVVLVLVDGLRLTDLAEGVNFQALVAKGSVGLMNTKTAAGRNAEGAYLTMGAGYPAAAGVEGRLGFNAEEELDGEAAARAYLRRMGRWPQGRVLSLGLAPVFAKNQGSGAAQPGLLGDLLHRAGLKTAVFGNADTPAGVRRQGVLLLMNHNGEVDYGDVGRGLLRESPNRALRLGTDYQALLDRLAAGPGAAVTAIQLGDLARLEEVQTGLLPEVAARERQQILQDMDNFLGQLPAAYNPSSTLFILAAPTPSKEDLKASRLFTPLVVAGPGFGSGGVLTSSTTRREGVVTNLDLLPTITSFLGLDYQVATNAGRPLSTLPGAANRLANLEQSHVQASFIYGLRPTAVKGWLALQIMTIALAVVAILSYPKAMRSLEWLLLWHMGVPLALLWGAWIPATVGAPGYLALVAGLALVVAAVTRYLGGWGEQPLEQRYLVQLAFVCLLTSAAIILDVLLGQPLMKRSLLGYDALAGARYYGIGNEYMGIVLGASLVGLGAWLQSVQEKGRSPSILPATAWLLLVLLVVALPSLGANVGGALSTAVAFPLGLAFWRNQRVSPGGLVATGAAALALLLALAVIDLNRAEEVRSHLGQVVLATSAGGWQVLLNVVERKLSMNLRLIRYTIWTRVLLAFLGGSLILLYRPRGFLKRVLERRRQLARGFAAAALGAGVALLVNDSGIVAAATTMLFPAMGLLLVLGWEQQGLQGKESSGLQGDSITVR